ncbi:MAG: LLM class flavin-dependent oxidoreductase [Alphaproteobacteria bacterium]|nr:LLM class flavin-dependent oxidoreductase [Alphaproteobacteria bacterium]
MKVFVFDLLAYGEQLEHLKIKNELPYPLPKQYFKPEVAARTYAEHLEAWEELDRLGYDGVGFNEHHCSPYGLMNSPNLLAAAAAQRTRRLKLLIYGNLLPLHEPLRLAEELAMLDCMSNGRLISGFARGFRESTKSTMCRCRNRGLVSKRRSRLSAGPGPRKYSPIRANFGPIETSRCGRGRCSSRIRRSGCRSSGAKSRLNSLPSTTCRSPRGWAARADCATTSSAITCAVLRKQATGLRPTICRSASAPMSPTARPKRCARWVPITSISTARYSAMATSLRPNCSGRPVMRAPDRPITSAPRTGARRNSPARTSAG